MKREREREREKRKDAHIWSLYAKITYYIIRKLYMYMHTRNTCRGTERNRSRNVIHQSTRTTISFSFYLPRRCGQTENERTSERAAAQPRPSVRTRLAVLLLSLPSFSSYYLRLVRKSSVWPASSFLILSAATTTFSFLRTRPMCSSVTVGR